MAPHSHLPHALAALAAGLALTLVTPTPAQAVTVTLTTSRTSAPPSIAVTFSGNVIALSAGLLPVALQRRLGTGPWITVKTGGILSLSDTYSLTTHVPAGTYQYRTSIGGLLYSLPKTVTGSYGRNVSVPAAGAPFTLTARLPQTISRRVKAQYSVDGTTWTTRGQATSNPEGKVGIRTYLTSTRYVRVIAPATSTLPVWAGPRGRVAIGTDPVIKKILDDTNAERARHGKRALKLHPSLNRVSGTWAYYMHATADPGDCGASYRHNPSNSSQIPSGWSHTAENIAAGREHENVVRAWIESPPHHKHIDGDYTHIGIGYHFGTKCYESYYVQNFAKY